MFFPQKVEITTLKSCSEKIKSTHFFELPKQKNCEIDNLKTCEFLEAFLWKYLFIEFILSLCLLGNIK